MENEIKSNRARRDNSENIRTERRVFLEPEEDGDRSNDNLFTEYC